MKLPRRKLLILTNVLLVVAAGITFMHAVAAAHLNSPRPALDRIKTASDRIDYWEIQDVNTLRAVAADDDSYIRLMQRSTARISTWFTTASVVFVILSIVSLALVVLRDPST